MSMTRSRYPRGALRRAALASLLCLAAGCGDSAAPDDKGRDSTGLFRFPQPEGAAFIAVTTDAAGRILAGGWIFSDLAGARMFIMRILPDGRPDGAFGGDGAVEFRQTGRPHSVIFDLAVDGAGRILACGLAYATVPDVMVVESSAIVARFLPDGSLDDSFGVNGVAEIPAALVGTQARCRQVAARGDRYVIAVENVANAISPRYPEAIRGLGATATAAATDNAFLAALAEAGQLDMAFGTAGLARIHTGFAPNPRFALDDEDRILVKFHDHVYAEFNDDLIVERRLGQGAPDPAFAEAGRLVLECGVSHGGVDGEAGLASDVIVATDRSIYLAGGWFGVSRGDGLGGPVLWKVDARGVADGAVRQRSRAALAGYGDAYLSGLVEVPGAGFASLLLAEGAPDRVLHLMADGTQGSAPRVLSFLGVRLAPHSHGSVLIAGLTGSEASAVPVLQIVPLGD